LNILFSFNILLIFVVKLIIMILIKEARIINEGKSFVGNILIKNSYIYKVYEINEKIAENITKTKFIYI